MTNLIFHGIELLPRKSQPFPTDELRKYLYSLTDAGWHVGPLCYFDEFGVCVCGHKDKNGLAPHTGRNIGKAPLQPKGKDDFVTTHQSTDNLVHEYHSPNWGMWHPDTLTLDVDREAGGFQSLAKLESDVGVLPDTKTNVTGNVGLHLFYLKPKDLELHGSKLLGYPGIDLRISRNAYVVVPHSHHIIGNDYYNLIDKPFAPIPPAIIDLIVNQKATFQQDSNIRPGELIHKGERDIWLFNRARAYRGKGDTEQQIRAKLAIDVLRCEVVPGDPITDADLDRIAKSVTNYSVNPAHNLPDSFVMVGDRKIPRARGIPCRNY